MDTERSSSPTSNPPAMGERRARWGYGYQDKVATERTLNSLRRDLRDTAAQFEGVRLADLDAGRVDDFVLIWRERAEGNSIKWSSHGDPINWGDLVGSNGLLKELADGFARLRSNWVGRTIKVRLHSNRIASPETHHAQLISSISVAEFLAKHWTVGPDSAQSADVSDAWRKISAHVGLAGSEFSTFVASCEISLGQPEPPGAGTDVLSPGPSISCDYASARDLIPMHFVPPLFVTTMTPVSSTWTLSRRRGVSQGSTKRRSAMPAAHSLTPHPYLPRVAPKADIAATPVAAKRYTWPLRCLASGVPSFEAITSDQRRNRGSCFMS